MRTSTIWLGSSRRCSTFCSRATKSASWYMTTRSWSSSEKGSVTVQSPSSARGEVEGRACERTLGRVLAQLVLRVGQACDRAVCRDVRGEHVEELLSGGRQRWSAGRPKAEERLDATKARSALAAMNQGAATCALSHVCLSLTRSS